jgi:hypothetical protein
MNSILTALTILTLSICGADKDSVVENQNIKKHTGESKNKVVIYKKVPTKWVKMPKKSN